MPTKSFDSLNIINVVEGYTLGPTGTATPTLSNPLFGFFSLSGTDSQVGVTVNTNFIYQKIGDVDFTNVIVGIPVNASITKVVVKTPRTGVINLTGAGGGGGCAISHIEGVYDGTTPLPDTDPSSISYNYSVSGLSAEVTTNYPTPITRAELITNHGAQLLQLGCGGSANRAGANFIDYSLSYDAGFEIRVTYFEGPFSWYIKPTVKVINGGKIRTIQDPEDILAVPDGDVAPPGFEFYGTDDDFPSGPVFVWWISDDFFQFFVFSPISPSIILGGSDWTNFGASPPTCAACLTIALGELTILIANASGIYTLTQGKTNDTLYLRADSSTFDFKIPNPFGKTGLVP